MIAHVTFSHQENQYISDHINQGKGWACTDTEFVALKSKIKDHYIRVQSNRCCYCYHYYASNHHAIWDIEHILYKEGYSRFLLEPKNLAASCKECNQFKHQTDVLVPVSRSFTRLPRSSARYKIVHPIFDVYLDHIDVQDLGGGKYLLCPKTKKGSETFTICNLFRFHLIYGGYSGLLNTQRDKLLRIAEDLKDTLGENSEHLKTIVRIAFAIR
ncbi:hypothetical protein [Aquirhabdus parva]|uniref:HNH endonuclease n=1 Tax=Aquirhabdus parva TaxID=2283318 RepID=A0A345P7K8_9GAMM|nr:hypothetical protein [Aquirhabdus parva]AXI03267.1 hypothetical protein HYN46_10700 [Aquirhabdus parva]